MLERVSNLARTKAPRARGLRTMLAAALLTVAAYATAAEMRADHPDSYVVQRGDTLWDISARFLKKPWLWPEIWQANPQIKNPHLIYPGDVISLAYLNRVTVQEGDRSASPINAVPLAEVEPFLKDLRVVPEIDNLPYVVGLEDGRLHASRGQTVYVRGLEDATPGQRYLVVRAERRYRGIAAPGHSDALDLDARGDHMRLTDFNDGFWGSLGKSGEMLGYELTTQTTGTVTRGPVGEQQVSTLLLDQEGRAVHAGDRLIPVEAQTYDLQFFPHAPNAQLNYASLSVMSIADHDKFGGTRDVIAISGGSNQGIDNGTVLSIWRNGSVVADRMKDGLNHDADLDLGTHEVQLPNEFAAHAMVFRTFNDVSYALVMSSTKPIHIGYALKHPDATN